MRSTSSDGTTKSYLLYPIFGCDLIRARLGTPPTLHSSADLVTYIAVTVIAVNPFSTKIAAANPRVEPKEQSKRLGCEHLP